MRGWSVTCGCNTGNGGREGGRGVSSVMWSLGKGMESYFPSV